MDEVSSERKKYKRDRQTGQTDRDRETDRGREADRDTEKVSNLVFYAKTTRQRHRETDRDREAEKVSN